MALTRAERRGSARRRIRLKVRYWTAAEESTGYTTDISSTGMFIEGRRMLDVRTRIHLEIEMKEGPFFAEGAVARVLLIPASASIVARNGMGIRLVTLAEAAKSLFAPAPGGVDAAKTAESTPVAQMGIDQPLALPGSDILDEANALKFSVDLRDMVRLKSAYDAEIHRGGIFIPTPQPLPRETEITVVFLLPPPHEPLEVEGTIVHVSQGPTAGIGVQLHHLDQVRGILSPLFGPKSPP